MDQFQSIQTGAGLLKNDYDDGDQKNPVSAALRQRAARIKAKIKIEDQLEEK